MLKVSDYPHLNAALSACASTFGDTGGQLHLDVDTTLISTGAYVCHNLAIIGDGETKVTPTFDNYDYLSFLRMDGSEIRNILLRDFCIVPSAGRDAGSGWAAKFHKAVRCTIDNVDLGLPETARHDGGFWFDGFDDCCLNNVKGYARYEALRVNGMADQSYGADLYIGGGSKFQNYKQPNLSDWQAGSSLIHIAGGAGGIEIASGDYIYGGVGLLIDTAVAGVQNREIFLNGPWFDSEAEDGVRVQSNSVGTFEATGTWVSSCNRANNGSIGVRIQPSQLPTMEGIWTGGRIFNNQGDGMDLNGGHMLISGTSFTDNQGYPIYAANSAAKGAVTGCGFGRNLNNTIRESVNNQLLKTGNWFY